jgi:gas vesicle protein
MNRGRFFLGGLLRLTFGALIGAAVALLYAPRSGDETRERIRKRADELMDEGKEKVTSQKERALELITRGKEKTSKSVDELKEKIQSAKERVSSKGE